MKDGNDLENNNKIDSNYIVKAYNSPEGVLKYLKAISEIGLWESEKKVIQRYVDTNDYILDIGCGVGRVTYNLFLQGYKSICGIDLSEEMIKAAINYIKNYNCNINYVVGDAANLPFQDNLYNSVLFLFNGLMLIPGIENRIKVMKEIKRVLKSEGILIFTAHNINADSNYKKFWENQKYLWDNGLNDNRLHEFGDIIDTEISKDDSFMHFPSDDEVSEMAEICGFNILFSDYRDNIAKENEKVKQFSSNCKFWVFKKNT